MSIKYSFKEIQHPLFLYAELPGIWRPQKAQATKIKEINKAKLPTQNNKQQTKQLANKKKPKHPQ